MAVDKHEVHDVETFNRYLEFNCNYKKYKGQTWGSVLESDPDYFMWVMVSCANVRTKTWSVLAMVLTEEQRAAAFKRANDSKLFKPAKAATPKKRKKGSSSDDDEGEDDKQEEEAAATLAEVSSPGSK